MPFKPLDLSKCRFEFATLCTAFFILVFDYLILFYLSLNIIVLVSYGMMIAYVFRFIAVVFKMKKVKTSLYI